VIVLLAWGTKPSGSGSPATYLPAQAIRNHTSCYWLRGNQACRQQFLGLLPAWASRSRVKWHCCPLGRTKPWAVGVLGSDCHKGLRECSTVMLVCAFCYTWSSRNHGSCLHMNASFHDVSG
jgi:hypothetical protein